VLLYLPSIASLFLYIPYTQRDWSFVFPGLGPALIDYLQWLRGRLADQQLITLVLLGLPLLGRRSLRVCYAIFVTMLLVSGAFSSEIKGLFAGSFLLKMDLFMFATCLGIAAAMIAAQVLDALAQSDKGLRWFWVLAVVAVLPSLGAAHKVLAYVAILGAGLAAVFVMRGGGGPGASPGSKRPAIALLVCLAATAMLVRQQNMTSGMFAPYAQGMRGHEDLAALATKNPQAPFRVACVDVHPVVAQNLGLDTVGGKSPLFNKDFKEIVREAIRPQFADSKQLQSFDNLWRQLYLTRLKVDLDQRTWTLDKAPARSVADFNWNALRALNVTHVLASRPMSGMESVAKPPALSPGYGEGSVLLGRLGLADKYALPLYVYELKDPLPRVYLAEAEFLPTQEAVLERLGGASMDELRTRVFLTAGEVRHFPAMPALRRYNPPERLPIGEVRIDSWSPDHVRISGVAHRPSVLVTVNNFDPHWKAVPVGGGEPLQTFRANHAFQGVAIAEAGPFSFDLNYSNPLIWWLNLASLLGIGMMFSCVFWDSAVGSGLHAKGVLTQWPADQPPASPLPWRTCLVAGGASASVWALAFALFVLGKQKGPQAQSFAYALATIPALGVLVACWTRSFLRRF